VTKRRICNTKRAITRQTRKEKRQSAGSGPAREGNRNEHERLIVKEEETTGHKKKNKVQKIFNPQNKEGDANTRSKLGKKKQTEDKGASTLMVPARPALLPIKHGPQI